MRDTNKLFGKNLFTKAFQEFDEDAFFENLHNKVKNKSYFEKYQGFKNTLLWLSYLFNLASALTAIYAIFWLVQWITGLAIVGYVMAGVFLFFLEKVKRKSSMEFFQVLFFRKEFAIGWFGLSLFCLALSLCSSGFGVKEGTENLSPNAELIATDSLATKYRNEVIKLETENEEFKKQRNHEGVIYHRTQASIKSNKKMIADYQTRILELDKKLEGKNELLSKSYMQEVKLTAWTMVWLTMLMELLFEACIAYVWYFYFRSYVERMKLSSVPADESTASTTAPPLPQTEEQKLLEKVQALESQINALRASKNPNGILTHPLDKTNGTEPSMSQRKPIGFFSAEERAETMELPTKIENESGQTWTPLDRAANTDSDDRFTIEHEYTKGGKQKKVRYTMRMVNSRIGQYKRELEEALNKELGTDVIENRRQWLAYWEEKRAELLSKQDSFHDSMIS